MADTLKARRDKIGRYYFCVVNPLERVRVVAGPSGERALTFDNLALLRGYVPERGAIYRYAIRQHRVEGLDPVLVPDQVVEAPRIPLSEALAQALRSRTGQDGAVRNRAFVLTIEIRTSYDRGDHWSHAVTVQSPWQPALYLLSAEPIQAVASAPPLASNYPPQGNTFPAPG